MISLIVISIVTIKPFQFKLRYTNDEFLITYKRLQLAKVLLN